MKYTIHFIVVELENGTLDVYDANGRKRWVGISKQGFAEILKDMVMA